MFGSGRKRGQRGSSVVGHNKPKRRQVQSPYVSQCSCSVCLDDNVQLVQLGACGHAICRGCMTSHLLHALKLRRQLLPELRCPMPQCHVRLALRPALQLLEQQVPGSGGLAAGALLAAVGDQRCGAAAPGTDAAFGEGGGGGGGGCDGDISGRGGSPHTSDQQQQQHQHQHQRLQQKHQHQLQQEVVRVEAMFVCPHADCALPLELDCPLRDLPSDCPGCGGAVCGTCRSRWHAGLTCTAYQALIGDRGGAGGGGAAAQPLQLLLPLARQLQQRLHEQQQPPPHGVPPALLPQRFTPSSSGSGGGGGGGGSSASPSPAPPDGGVAPPLQQLQEHERAVVQRLHALRVGAPWPQQPPAAPAPAPAAVSVGMTADCQGGGGADAQQFDQQQQQQQEEDAMAMVWSPGAKPGLAAA